MWQALVATQIDEDRNIEQASRDDYGLDPIYDDRVDPSRTDVTQAKPT